MATNLHSLRSAVATLLLVLLAINGLSCAASDDPTATPVPGGGIAENSAAAGMKAEDYFLVCESSGQAGRHRYGLFFPRSYDASKKYPAVVFLHGVGEQGDDGRKCCTGGLGPAIVRKKGDVPFIAIFPQTGGDWTSGDSEKIMLDALADVKKHFSIDEQRIALTGLSTGGKGVWVLGARHPETFSCLIPIAA